MKNPQFFLIAIIVLGTMIFFHKIYLNDRAKREYQKFNEAHIDGKIVKVRSGLGTTSFLLENDDEEYAFNPKSSKERKTFNTCVEKGDRVFKAKHSKVIQLFKKNKKLEFPFHEYK